MSVSVLATLGPLFNKGTRQDPSGHSALSQRSPLPPFLNRMPLFLPCVPLQESDQNPAWCELGGLGRAQGWEAVPALSWPSHIQEVSPSFPFLACAGPVCDRIGPGE